MPTTPVSTPASTTRSDLERRRAARSLPAGPWIITGLAVVLTAALLAWVQRGMTFFWDEWLVIVGRLPASNLAQAYLEPHFQHFIAVDLALYRGVFALAGLHEYWPYQLVPLAGHLLVVGLLLELGRRRLASTPPVVALVAPIALLGTAWETLLLPFNGQWMYSAAAMVAVVLLLDHRTVPHDLTVFAILLVVIATSSFGPIVAAGVTLRLLWEPGRWRRVWIAAVPLAVYVAWYAKYDANAPPGFHFSLSLSYALDTAAGTMAGLLGVPLNAGPVMHHSWLAAPFGLLAVALLVAVVAFWRRLTPNLVMLFTMLAGYWAALTLTRNQAGAPYTSRYIYVSAVLLVVIAFEYLRGRVLMRSAQRAIVGVGCLAAVLNTLVLVHYGNAHRGQSAVTLGEISALAIGRPFVSGRRVVDSVTAPITASDFFTAIDRLHSTPALSPAELVRAPEPTRRAADRTLIATYDVHPIRLTAAVRAFLIRGLPARAAPALERASATPSRTTDGCLVLDSGGGSGTQAELRLVAPGISLEPLSGATATVAVRRFGAAFTALSAVGPRGAWIGVPADSAALAWQLELTSSGPVRVCSTPPARG